ncbi:hypothetical protein H6G93_15615 [Nostoc sp. FACHB-973]|nr:hypothetical protein [Nostoc sp. FACHB-973]
MRYSRSSTQQNLLAKSDIKVETKTIWSKPNSSHLRLVPSKAPKSSVSITAQIQKLVEELVEKIEEVQRVKAIATRFPDIHWIDFEIELEGDIDLSDETWDKIQDMVIDCEWKLRDDSGEKWYFHPQLVNRFCLLEDEVIADSENKQNTEISRFKISSSNSPKYVVHKDSEVRDQNSE